MKKCFIKHIALGVVLTCFACQFRAESDIDKVRNAMGSLIFVGEAPDNPNSHVGNHGFTSLPFPKNLMKGRQYIFHRKRSKDESWIEIETALRAHRAEIIDAPRGNVGLGYAFVGGPYFVIAFRMGQIQYCIQNYMALEVSTHQLSDVMEQQDFVLRVQ
jgi:hypothetical protein